MPDGILIGPVPGVPETDSIEIIVRDILDKTPDNIALFEKYADGFSRNTSKGVMLVHMKPHLAGDIIYFFLWLYRPRRVAAPPFRQALVSRGSHSRRDCGVY
jgi:hypothetical protein